MGVIDDLVDPLDRLLGDLSKPDAVRAAERGGLDPALWTQLGDSGFLDALVPEARGGAGLSLVGLSPLLELPGRHLVPAPFVETMAARAYLGNAGHAPPDGPILLVTATPRPGGGIGQDAVPSARLAEWALVDDGVRLLLLPMAAADISSSGVHGSHAASLFWDDDRSAHAILPRPADGLRPLAAVLRSCEIAGMMDAVLRMTVRYAGERVQFGKPIGKLQAIQQQLSVAAEQLLMAQMAAAIGCSGGIAVPVSLAAVAKQCTSAGSVALAAIAHAVHGAMGISEAYDLQLYTRRLYEWRLADGSESYWAERTGHARLEAKAATTIDFLKTAATEMENAA